VSFILKDTLSTTSRGIRSYYRIRIGSPRPTDRSESTVEIKSHSCINSIGRQDRQAPQAAVIGVYYFSIRRHGILLISTTDRSYNKDRLDPQDQGIDSVLLAASIRQSGPSIRLSGTSCIGILFHSTLWILLEDSIDQSALYSDRGPSKAPSRYIDLASIIEASTGSIRA